LSLKLILETRWEITSNPVTVYPYGLSPISAAVLAIIFALGYHLYLRYPKLISVFIHQKIMEVATNDQLQRRDNPTYRYNLIINKFFNNTIESTLLML